MAAQINRGQKALALPMPAPVGGLNARDSLAAMPPTDASVMTNWFPYADRVATRAGHALLSTATTAGAANTEEGFRQLMVRAGSTSEELFGCFSWVEDLGGGSLYRRVRIYSVNLSTGALTNVMEVSVAGTPNSVHGMGEWVQFGSAAGTSYLLMVVAFATITPAQTCRLVTYDGTTWALGTAITGPPYGTLGLHAHRNRLWFYNSTATNPLSAWYLPVGAISGTAAEYNLASFATKGGRIVAMRTWTLDGGVGGTDDMAVFLTNNGQAIVFEGTDPSASATWRLVGVFEVGPVASYIDDSVASGTTVTIRDSQAMKYGSDLLFLLQSGLTSANRVLRPQQDEGADYSLSKKIRPLISDAAKTWRATASVFGISAWKMTVLPQMRQLIISVPTSRTQTQSSPIMYQTVTDWYVMNTETGAWTKFQGMNSADMVKVGTTLYFTDGQLKLYKYDGTAADDAGTAITYECRQAYHYLNSPNNKTVTLMQPMLRATGNFSLTVQADADYNPGTISSYTSYTIASEQNVQPWLSPGQYGKTVAAHLKGQTSAGVVSWYATNWLYTIGGFI